MPLPMVHLAVSKKLINTLNIANKGAFYLGSIAPDAVHTRPEFSYEDKVVSHLTNDNLEIWKKNVIEFMRGNVNGINADFYLGYGFHILTDIFWSETIYSMFNSKYAKDLSPIQDRQTAYYNDSDQLDFLLHDRLDYWPEIWSYLLKSVGIDVNGLVSLNEINTWNAKVLHWYDNGESRHKNPIRYISYNDLLLFIQETPNKIKEWWIL
jgi:hypothetical protein